MGYMSSFLAETLPLKSVLIMVRSRDVNMICITISFTYDILNCGRQFLYSKTRRITYCKFTCRNITVTMLLFLIIEQIRFKYSDCCVTLRSFFLMYIWLVKFSQDYVQINKSAEKILEILRYIFVYTNTNTHARIYVCA